MQRSLTLSSLAALDSGAAGAIVEAALREAVADLDDRGQDQKPRQVLITVSMTQLENGQVAVDVDAAAKLPRRRTASTFCRIKKEVAGASLQFQEWSPEHPDQRTIDEALEANRGRDE